MWKSTNVFIWRCVFFLLSMSMSIMVLSESIDRLTFVFFSSLLFRFDLVESRFEPTYFPEVNFVCFICWCKNSKQKKTEYIMANMVKTTNLSFEALFDQNSCLKPVSGSLLWLLRQSVYFFFLILQCCTENKNKKPSKTNVQNTKPCHVSSSAWEFFVFESSTHLWFLSINICLYAAVFLLLLHILDRIRWFTTLHHFHFSQQYLSWWLTACR